MATFSELLRPFAGKIGFAPLPAVAPQPVNEKSAPARSPEAQVLFTTQSRLIEQVRAEATQLGQRPTLEQYRLACEAFSATEQGAAMTACHEWNPRIYADLSGQDVSGFTITEPKKQEAAHHLDPQPEQPEKKETHGHHNNIGKNYDGNDLDGDGQINVPAAHEFYDNIRFDKADLHGAWVEPATSFNEEISRARNLEGLTFSGMKEGDVFTFGAGNYRDAHLVNVDDGKIVFGAHSHVDGITIDGQRAKITIGDHATVDHIAVGEHFRIISLDMGRNSVLANSDLGQSTVSMTSHFEPGATFQNVNLSGNLAGLDFSGLKLNNVTIDGAPITSARQLGDHGITHDAATLVTASPALVQSHELAQIRETMQHAVHEIAAPASPPAAELDGLAAIRATMQQSVKSIGKPLNAGEMAALQQTQAAREARLEQTQSMTPALPGRKQ